MSAPHDPTAEIRVHQQLAKSELILLQAKLKAYSSFQKETRILVQFGARQLNIDPSQISNWMHAQETHTVAEESMLKLAIKKKEGELALYEDALKQMLGTSPLDVTRKRLVVPGIGQ